ncbi:MAG TPA: GNAT family N-acetyltransferase [Rhodanobacteraceae bacterium]|nr:GNAT family N-acetyltransferase [Rhodanobacteraceae bacterium]
MDAPARRAFVTAPEIRTQRLRLRAHRAEDFEGCRAIWSDPEVVRHISGKPSTGEEAWRRLLTSAGLWSVLGFGYWAIEEQASGKYIGDIGFAEFQRDIDPPLRGMLECGWVLARAAQGQGYASEALAAIEAWRCTHLPGRRAVCIIAPANAPSVRVAEKAGFRRWCETTYHGAATLVFSGPQTANDA